MIIDDDNKFIVDKLDEDKIGNIVVLYKQQLHYRKHLVAWWRENYNKVVFTEGIKLYNIIQTQQLISP